jgi:phenylacetate-CoA ligase
LRGIRLAIAAGEPLDERARQHAEKWLGCPVYFQYGTRELGTFAQECTEKAGYHYAQDLAYCEVIDDAGIDVEHGHLAITYFGNRVVPLIRYKGGDGASMELSVCACGRPYQRLRSIDGRIAAMIRTPDQRAITSLVFPHIFKDYAWIREFQVEQTGTNRLVVRVRRNDGAFSASSLTELEAKIHGLIGHDNRLEWDFDSSFIEVPSGKHVYFISRLG